MSQIKHLLAFLILFALALQVDAQYKRKGETLTNRGGKTSSTAKKADYTLQQLKGKWQEFERKDRNTNTVVDFADSIQLKFLDSNKVQTRTSVITTMSMEGYADIDTDNTLTAAADEYTIKSLTATELVLDDNDKFIHRLKKLDSFWFEKLGKLSVRVEDFSSPIKAGINNILGSWTIFRRRAKPGATKDEVELIKSLNIPDKVNESTASGFIVFYKGQTSQQLPCTVYLKGTNIDIVAGKRKWDLAVYQADKNYFVFGNSSLLYFSKPAK
jgi:hypothetical protein